MNQYSSETIIESARRFWSYVERAGANECWVYRGMIDDDGYGRFAHLKQRHGAHRVAFCLAGGALAEGKVIRHSCDNPACCNPAHLSIGTHAENAADRDERGRQAKGEKNGRSKLTVEIVQQILASEQSESSVSVSRRLGAHVALVRDIRKRKTWQHVEIPEPQP